MDDIVLVTFADWRYALSRRRLVQSATRVGIKSIFQFSPATLRRTEFYRDYRSILDQERGAGYWLWKPYYMLQTLESVREGQIVMYCDAGAEIIAPVAPLVELAQMNRGVALFQIHGRQQIHWCKRDCFILMDCDKPEYHAAVQRAGGFQFYVKSDFTVRFVREWLRFACDPRALTDQPNTCGKPNYPGFVEHRHDQAVLTNLCVKYGLVAYRDPSQFGAPFYGCRPDPPLAPPHEGVSCEYPTIFRLHRRRLPHPLRAVRNLMRNPREFTRLALANVRSWRHR